MDRHAVLVLASAFLIVGAVEAQDAKKELRKLEGTWTMLTLERGGEKLPDEQIKGLNAKLILKGDKYTVKFGDQVREEGSIKVDAAKNPKTMDILAGEGPNKGKTFRIIYELDGDNFKACYGEADGERPKEFKTEAGSPAFIIIYKREKP